MPDQFLILDINVVRRADINAESALIAALVNPEFIIHLMNDWECEFV